MNAEAPPPLLKRLLIVDDDKADEVIIQELNFELPDRSIYINGVLLEKSDSIETEYSSPPLYIDVATTVEDALAIVNESIHANDPYDIAILDYKLPETRGRQPHGDFRVSEQLARRSRPTIVIRLTAYPNDSELQSREPYLGSLIIDKNAEDWWPTLWLQMTMALHTRRLRRRMAELLGQEDPVGMPVSLRSRKAGTLNRCFEERWQRLKLADFYTDAAEHWDLLARALQQDIEREFGCRIIDGQRVIGAGSDRGDEGEEADLQPRGDS